MSFLEWFDWRVRASDETAVEGALLAQAAAGVKVFDERVRYDERSVVARRRLRGGREDRDELDDAAADLARS